MNEYEMAAFVVLVVMTGAVLRAWIRTRGAAGTGPTGMTPEQHQRMSRLEERVKALESVVGDASYELKQKFKDLERG